jgi:hypothetical protein
MEVNVRIEQWLSDPITTVPPSYIVAIESPSHLTSQTTDPMP